MFASLPCHEAQRLTHRDFPIIQQWYCSFTLSSIFNKVVMLGVWLSRFGGRCLFDFGASSLVGSVFSNVKRLGMFASLSCHEAQRLTHRDFPIIQQWYCSFTLVGNNMLARPSKFMGLNFVSAVSLLFFYLSWSERCSGSCKLHVLNFGKVICGTHELLLRVGSG